MRTWRPLGWAAGTASFLVIAHNARVALRMRAVADEHEHLLVHDRTVSPGARGEAEPVRVIFLGDSSATGFGLSDAAVAYPSLTGGLLAQRVGRPVRVRVLAVRGARLRHVAELQVPVLAGLQPDLVIVSAGGNDVLGRRLPSQVRRDQQAMVRAIRRTAPGVPIFVGGSGDLGAPPAIPAPLSWLLSAWSRAVIAAQRSAAAEDGVPFGTLGRQPPGNFGPDGFHAGVEAHRLAAELTIAALTDAGILDRLAEG